MFGFVYSNCIYWFVFASVNLMERQIEEFVSNERKIVVVTSGGTTGESTGCEMLYHRGGKMI